MVSQAEPLAPAASPRSAVAERIRRLRALLVEQGLDALLVRATDRYLNEYVPEEESLRVFITGFSGSMGDALLTRDRALLFIDGRYTLQAEKEAPDFERRQIPLGRPIESGWLDILPELAAQGVARLGVDTETVPAGLYRRLQAEAEKARITLVPAVPSPVRKVRADELGERRAARGKVWPVGRELSGRSLAERLSEARGALEAAGVDGLLVIPLDEIAWITNLRGDHFAYQATFRSQAIVLRDRVILAAEPRALQGEIEPSLEVCGEGGLFGALERLLGERGSIALGYAEDATPEAMRRGIEERGIKLVPMASPFAIVRTRKTRAELEHMADAFRRADEVVKKVQRWLAAEVSRGKVVTEADVAAKVKKLFLRSGAFGLSFKVIAAAGKNGAIIHYSKPDGTTPIREGELFLLDTGAYYEGGYATDLTRTFLVGKPHVKAGEEQRALFTAVLKGAIAGMSARIPKGSTGEQLDALVRDPLWRAGYDYAHGTGHGVGVNVHEFPPRVTTGSRVLLETGQVFSIEPGVYLPERGGVRIENLVTLVEDPDDARFLRVRPLTFSPLDKRLIEKRLLTAHEKAFLDWYAAQEKAPSRLDAPLPPVSA